MRKVMIRVGMAAGVVLLTGLVSACSEAEWEDGPAQAGESELKVTVLPPPAGHWSVADSGSHLDVVLENASMHDIRIFDPDNSWGWPNLSLEWKTQGARGTVSRPEPMMGWTANPMTTTTLPPGGTMTQTVDVNDDWQGWPKFHEGMTLEVRAIYQSKSGPPGWQGRAVSDWVTMGIHDVRTK